MTKDGRPKREYTVTGKVGRPARLNLEKARAVERGEESASEQSRNVL
jgi:hypothetical protein